MAIKEGKWRCPACSAVNAGRDMKCSSCGAVRGPEVSFFLDDDAQEVTDESLLATAKAGGDWHCAFCGTDNRAGIAVCRQCGAPREGMKSREASMLAKPQDAPAGQAGAGAARSPRRKPAKFLIPIVLAAIAAVAALVILARGREDSLTLRDGEWARAVHVERQSWVQREGWKDSAPAGARILRSWEAQRSTERVQVGTERVKTGTKDLGNGFFQDVFEERPVYREKPVYGTMVSYEILEWGTYRQAESRGGLEDPPAWPALDLGPGDREGPRSELARLYFVSDDPEKAGKVFTYDGLKPEELRGYSKGKRYAVRVLGDRVTTIESGD